MKEYVALITGSGIGCDYTIGCNKRWEFFEAEDMDDAKRIVFQGEDEDDEDEDTIYGMGFCMGDSPEEITIIEIADQDDADIFEWESEKEEEEAKRKAKDEEEAERAELERLKKKYEE